MRLCEGDEALDPGTAAAQVAWRGGLACAQQRRHAVPNSAAPPGAPTRLLPARMTASGSPSVAAPSVPSRPPRTPATSRTKSPGGRGARGGVRLAGGPRGSQDNWAAHPRHTHTHARAGQVAPGAAVSPGRGPHLAGLPTGRRCCSRLTPFLSTRTRAGTLQQGGRAGGRGGRGTNARARDATSSRGPIRRGAPQSGTQPRGIAGSPALRPRPCDSPHAGEAAPRGRVGSSPANTRKPADSSAGIW